MRHLISVDDLEDEFITQIYDHADYFKVARKDRGQDWFSCTQALRNQILITDFFEPSTRTRLSFEAAMSYLGGNVIGTENAADFSSIKKGESIYDNFKVISGYGDIIVGRFRQEGEARLAADASEIPLINGGDGKGEHPTQALIDGFIIDRTFPSYDGLTVTFIGDNEHSRTVKSLFKMLSRHNVEMNFLNSPTWKADPTWRLHHGWKGEGTWIRPDTFRGTQEVERTIRNSHVVYMTRNQVERHQNMLEDVAPRFVLDQHYVDMLPDTAIILHPLPRNEELPAAIDADPRARYFEQAHNGLFIRMALLEQLQNG
jgi:aspartate carbamoyltransferase catalytic subunit